MSSRQVSAIPRDAFANLLICITLRLSCRSDKVKRLSAWTDDPSQTCKDVKTRRFIQTPLVRKYGFCQTARLSGQPVRRPLRTLLSKLSGIIFEPQFVALLTPSLGHITDHLLAGHCHIYCCCPASSPALHSTTEIFMHSKPT